MICPIILGIFSLLHVDPVINPIFMSNSLQEVLHKAEIYLVELRQFTLSDAF